MASEHPKITSYIPRDILEALDKWKEEHEIDSRNAAIVAILADYLGVQHPVRLPDTAPLSIHLHTVLDELARISRRMDALEASLGTAPQEVPSTVQPERSVPTGEVQSKLLSTVLASPSESSSTAPSKVSGTAPPERGVATGEVQSKLPSTALTQMALAKRLGCSDKAIEKHRKQGDKESFAQWSRDRDPENIAWTWEGAGGRGQPLRFLPMDGATAK